MTHHVEVLLLVLGAKVAPVF